ncbi:MAG: PAS domain-containing protein [Maritimibacter sp.]|nr:PAS domain-containing protein [Maritimibacter sp.]
MKNEYVVGDNVVSIAPVRARTLFPALSRIESYWEALRDGRAMPTRAEIDPRGIADVLEFAFVLEKVAPGLARIRLAGMHLNELMAMEVRGMPITAMFLPEARRELQRVIENVLESPAAVRLVLESDKGFARPPLQAQMMLLPLRDAEGRVTRILGALQARGPIGRGPRRFLIRDIETKALGDDKLTRKRPDLSAYAEPAEPRPALRPIGADRSLDGFAPRTMELARRIAERQKAPRPVRPVSDAPAAPADAGHGHLRLVFDADRV